MSRKVFALNNLKAGDRFSGEPQRRDGLFQSTSFAIRSNRTIIPHNFDARFHVTYLMNDYLFNPWLPTERNL